MTLLTIDGKRQYDAETLASVPSNWFFSDYLPRMGSDEELARRIRAGEKPISQAAQEWKRLKEGK